MENRIEISLSSPASAVVPAEGLPTSHPLSRSLNRLRENPRPAKENQYVTERYMPPVTVYFFNDGEYVIGYGLSYLPNEGIDLISVYSIHASA